MKRISVSSSNLASVGYDAVSQILEVEFNSGRIYQYFDMPQAEYGGLMVASLHGRYFDQNIRNSYRYTRIR